MEQTKRALRVLVIDDDTGLRDSLLEALGDEGHSAEGVSDGEAALERLSRLPVPNIVVLDLMLPHVDGWEVLRRMRATERLRRIPVIVVSSEGSRLSETQGADALLPKPFKLRGLFDLLDRFGAAQQES